MDGHASACLVYLTGVHGSADVGEGQILGRHPQLDVVHTLVSLPLPHGPVPRPNGLSLIRVLGQGSRSLWHWLLGTSEMLEAGQE